VTSELDAATVAPLLGTAWLGQAWWHLDRCGSTNDVAAAWARGDVEGRGRAPHGAVVVTEIQESGRGRQGRRWHQAPGESLAMSIVLRPPLPPSRLPPITLVAGVAVAEAVARHEVRPRLKWPNDVLAGDGGPGGRGRKLAGILTELVGDAVVVGIGVNLNATSLPDEIAEIATTLRIERGRPVDRALFAAALCERLEAWTDRFIAEGPAPVAAAWRTHADFFGRPISIVDGSRRTDGIADGLDDEGALRLRLPDGRTLRIVAGEVSPVFSVFSGSRS
jgi:BirA family biotin operon repressor/biotin-[acetyl-CoA-carboxylase] ligase